MRGALVTFMTIQPKIYPKVKVKSTFTGMNHNLAKLSMVIVFAR